MSYEPKYLLLVDNDNNGTQSNKYYRMIPNGDSFSVEYGRVGANPQKRTYSISQWDKKYSEKIKKGYRDESELYQDLFTEEVSKTENPDYKEIENKVVREIVNKLQQLAKNTVSKNYKVSSNKVTQAMIDKAQELLDSLVNFNGTVDEFNKALLELYSVIPRKMKDVNDHLVKNKEDFDKKIVEENDILTTMRSQVYIKTVQDEDNEEVKPIHDMTILEALGLEIEEATAADIDLIKNKMAESKHLFKRAWKVTNKNTQKRYDKFVKDNNIKDTRLLFHGSRSENFWSILQTGLVLRPTNAIITGKMFGMGIYYAPKCRKSVGYTSLHGSYWARGGSNTAYMALFDVAYGTPYDVYNFDSKYYSLDYNKLQTYKKGANCLHAHSDRGMLQNDEIVVYKEEQMTIKYLIEIGD